MHGYNTQLFRNYCTYTLYIRTHSHTHIDYRDIYRPEVELERSVQTLHRRDAGVTKDVREVGTSLVVWLYRNRGVCGGGGGGGGGIKRYTVDSTQMKSPKELGCPNEQWLGGVYSLTCP